MRTILTPKLQSPSPCQLQIQLEKGQAWYYISRSENEYKLKWSEVLKGDANRYSRKTTNLKDPWQKANPEIQWISDKEKGKGKKACNSTRSVRSEGELVVGPVILVEKISRCRWETPEMINLDDLKHRRKMSPEGTLSHRREPPKKNKWWSEDRQGPLAFLLMSE